MDISGGAVDFIDALAGRWRVNRVLRHQGGGWMRFSGRASWEPVEGGMHCVEEGEMVQDGQSFAARRETLWTGQGDQVSVAFGDGRPFHVFRLSLVADALHDCPPDTYRLRYDFRASGFWSARWHVTGPRKAYHALTRYTRSEAASPS